jgi:hypothetical protein
MVKKVYSQNVLKSRIQSNSFYTDFSRPHMHTHIRTHKHTHTHVLLRTHYPADRDGGLVLETFSPKSLVRSAPSSDTVCLKYHKDIVLP